MFRKYLIVTVTIFKKIPIVTFTILTEYLIVTVRKSLETHTTARINHTLHFIIIELNYTVI